MAKVMLVEDDNNLREIYEARLAAEGYDIVSAHDGEEALALAVKERPDLIISDIMMPKISGFDMLDILRSTPETKNTKVIMMTALGQAEDRNRADKLGADRYLVKSQVTLEDVIRVAGEVLNDIDGTSPTPTSPAPANNAAPNDGGTVASVPVVAAPPEEPPAAEPTPPPAAVPPEPAATPAADPPAKPITVQTEAQEDHTVEQQIQDFVANNPALNTAPKTASSTGSAPAAEPPAAPADKTQVPAAAAAQPATPAAPPASPAAPQQPASASKTVSIPVIEIPEPDPDRPAPAVTRTEVSAPTGASSVPEAPSRKKLVIQPTDNALAPAVDLNALLAKEKDADTITPPQTSAVITPDTSPGTALSGNPGTTVDPDQIAL